MAWVFWSMPPLSALTLVNYNGNEPRPLINSSQISCGNSKLKVLTDSNWTKQHWFGIWRSDSDLFHTLYLFLKKKKNLLTNLIFGLIIGFMFSVFIHIYSSFELFFKEMPLVMGPCDTDGALRPYILSLIVCCGRLLCLSWSWSANVPLTFCCCPLATNFQDNIPDIRKVGAFTEAPSLSWCVHMEAVLPQAKSRVPGLVYFMGQAMSHQGLYKPTDLPCREQE